jgi:hypothetical protein
MHRAQRHDSIPLDEQSETMRRFRNSLSAAKAGRNGEIENGNGKIFAC